MLLLTAIVKYPTPFLLRVAILRCFTNRSKIKIPVALELIRVEISYPLIVYFVRKTDNVFPIVI